MHLLDELDEMVDVHYIEIEVMVEILTVDTAVIIGEENEDDDLYDDDSTD